MISQNSPFTPIHDAWYANSRAILPMDDDIARKQVEDITAKVLSNRKPPYPIIGGLFDAMKDAGGEVLLATNDQLAAAGDLFLKAEGNDIHPASAVAVATLVNAAKDNSIDKDALIMLNITGGGEERFKSEHELYYLKPKLVFPLNPDKELVFEKLKNLF